MAEAEDPRPFRPCVGIMLFNGDGKVFVGARIDIHGDHWQMPQGGIDEGESPRDAALRELAEETGTEKAEIVAECDHWINYTLPGDLSRQAWEGRYQGQTQRWFAMRFNGSDDDIRIDGPHPEFKAWRWADVDELAELTVPFKQASYREVISAFRHLVKP